VNIELLENVMSRDTSELDRLLKTVGDLPKREETEKTDWRLHLLIRAEKQLWVAFETKEGSRYVLVAKGTYLGALLRYCKTGYVPGAQLTKNGVPCNLAERVDEECTVSYK
jgi:hypothetical protein